MNQPEKDTALPEKSAILKPFLKMTGTVLRSGPADGRRMNLPLKSSEIYPWSVIHVPFSRTARRSILAFG